LMAVPASDPSRLTLEFSVMPPGAGTDPYSNDLATTQRRIPYGHLLNFFGSSATGTNFANLSLLLEYLQVPSPFVGTESVLSPRGFAWADSLNDPQGRHGH